MNYVAHKGVISQLPAYNPPEYISQHLVSKFSLDDIPPDNPKHDIHENIVS